MQNPNGRLPGRKDVFLNGNDVVFPDVTTVQNGEVVIIKKGLVLGAAIVEIDTARMVGAYVSHLNSQQTARSQPTR